MFSPISGKPRVPRLNQSSSFSTTLPPLERPSPNRKQTGRDTVGLTHASHSLRAIMGHLGPLAKTLPTSFAILGTLERPLALNPNYTATATLPEDVLCKLLVSRDFEPALMTRLKEGPQREAFYSAISHIARVLISFRLSTRVGTDLHMEAMGQSLLDLLSRLLPWMSPEGETTYEKRPAYMAIVCRDAPAFEVLGHKSPLVTLNFLDTHILECTDPCESIGHRPFLERLLRPVTLGFNSGLEAGEIGFVDRILAQTACVAEPEHDVPPMALERHLLEEAIKARNLPIVQTLIDREATRSGGRRASLVAQGLILAAREAWLEGVHLLAEQSSDIDARFEIPKACDVRFPPTALFSAASISDVTKRRDASTVATLLVAMGADPRKLSQALTAPFGTNYVLETAVDAARRAHNVPLADYLDTLMEPTRRKLKEADRDALKYPLATARKLRRAIRDRCLARTQHSAQALFEAIGDLLARDYALLVEEDLACLSQIWGVFRFILSEEPQNSSPRQEYPSAFADLPVLLGQVIDTLSIGLLGKQTSSLSGARVSARRRVIKTLLSVPFRCTRPGAFADLRCATVRRFSSVARLTAGSGPDGMSLTLAYLHTFESLKGKNESGYGNESADNLGASLIGQAQDPDAIRCALYFGLYLASEKWVEASLARACALGTDLCDVDAAEGEPTLLHAAAMAGDPYFQNIIDVLPLDIRDALLATPNSSGDTPLHLLIRQGIYALKDFSRLNLPERCWRIKNCMHRTPYLEALASGHLGNLKLLGAQSGQLDEIAPDVLAPAIVEGCVQGPDLFLSNFLEAAEGRTAFARSGRLVIQILARNHRLDLLDTIYLRRPNLPDACDLGQLVFCEAARNRHAKLFDWLAARYTTSQAQIWLRALTEKAPLDSEDISVQLANRWLAFRKQCARVAPNFEIIHSRFAHLTSLSVRCLQAKTSPAREAAIAFFLMEAQTAIGTHGYQDRALLRWLSHCADQIVEALRLSGYQGIGLHAAEHRWNISRAALKKRTEDFPFAIATKFGRHDSFWILQMRDQVIRHVETFAPASGFDDYLVVTEPRLRASGYLRSEAGEWVWHERLTSIRFSYCQLREGLALVDVAPVATRASSDVLTQCLDPTA